jgi:hypothetical protein
MKLVTLIYYEKPMCEYGLLGYNAGLLRENSTFRRITQHPSLGSKSKPSKKPVEAGGDLAFSEQHGVPAKKTFLFIITAVKTAHPPLHRGLFHAMPLC